MTEPDVHVIRYDTLLECMAAFLECEWDEVECQEGIWKWACEDGVRHEQPMQEAIVDILTNDLVWGWAEDKNWLHIWFSDRCSRERLLGALAHELGHIRRPFHRDVFKEETKACKYGSVAMTAYAIMKDLMEARDVKA